MVRVNQLRQKRKTMVIIRLGAILLSGCKRKWRWIRKNKSYWYGSDMGTSRRFLDLTDDNFLLAVTEDSVNSGIPTNMERLVANLKSKGILGWRDHEVRELRFIRQPEQAHYLWMPYPCKHSRSGGMGFWSTWPSKKCCCSCQGIRIRGF